MPHITFPLADLKALSRDEGLTLERLDKLTTLVKGELKLRHSSDASVKVELQDTNRPDTWCVEGIARQLRQHRQGRADRYPFFEAMDAPQGAIEVDPSVKAVRPFVAGFTAKGWAVDEPGLVAFIAAQEVLCRNFGRNRKGVAIGIYDGSRLQWPVRYEAVGLDDRKRAFVPLAPAEPGNARDGEGRPIAADRWRSAWTPAEVLRDHPTGREYAAALGGHKQAPLLVDAKGEVLSFPPIINSAGLGRVVPGMRELFVEVTGTVLDQVMLAANILAANLADRGAVIGHVVTRYPYDTERGREVRCPHPLADRRTVDVPLADFRALLGEPELKKDEVVRWLGAYGVAAEPHGAARTEGEVLRATAPPWRLDYLHAVDAIEDFAMARGYEAMGPLMPDEFTVGALAPSTTFADVVRERLLGLGFEEGIGNILTAAEEVRRRMRLDGREDFTPLHGGPLVRLKNVMSQSYEVLRDWLLPTLLEVERRSTGAVYPHRVFEVGEVGLWDASKNLASRTELRAGALLAHDRAGFSELQGALDQLLRSFGLAFGAAEGKRGAYALRLRDHPSFIPGRAAWVEVAAGGRTEVLGVLGEVHPEVLERWGIGCPVVGFELRLDALQAVAQA